MVDGAAMILGPFFVAATNGFWSERGTNHLDGGAHFYNVYATSDGKWVSVGAIEPQFYAELLERLGVTDDEILSASRQNDRSVWAEGKRRFAAIFATRTRAEWETVFDGSDACFAPVLAPHEVVTHPHTAARGVTVDVNGSVQAQIAPRFSRTAASAREPGHPGAIDIGEIIAEWG
jgi:alpha-methylacyl-CoA racemase